MPASRRKSSSAGPNRKRSSASSSRPVPATTPYLRPCGRCRAKTSNTARRTAHEWKTTDRRWIPVSVAPVELDQPKSGEDTIPARPWVAIVWNDPVNLMSYVTYVFQQVFGYSRKKAERLMLDVHHKGKAVV